MCIMSRSRVFQPHRDVRSPQTRAQTQQNARLIEIYSKFSYSDKLNNTRVIFLLYVLNLNAEKRHIEFFQEVFVDFATSKTPILPYRYSMFIVKNLFHTFNTYTFTYNRI